MQHVWQSFSTHPLTPALSLTTGLLLSILGLMFAALSPSVPILWVAGLTGVVFWLLGRFLFCGVMLGLLAVGLNAPLPYAQTYEHCTFFARVTQPNYSNRYLGQNIRFDAKTIRCQQGVLPDQTLQFWDNHHQLSNVKNDVLKVSATLSPVHSRLNPYHFDYEKHLLSEGVRLSAKNLHLLESNSDFSPWSQLQYGVANAIQTHLSAQSAGIILAILTGNRSALSPEQKASLQATGTSHLLAISGLHIALVGGIIWLSSQYIWALSWRLSDWISPRHVGAVMALFAITFYAVFTGFDVPVKRAWVMFSLLTLSWLWGRGITNYSLLLAACAVMIVSPYAVVSVGFYFSFIATFVVLWCSRLPYLPLVNVLLMQACINLILLPITWWTFGTIPLSAYFVNLLVIPWLGLWVLPWAIVAVIFSSLSSVVAAPIWRLLDHTTAMLWQTIATAEQLHWTLSPESRPVLSAVVIAVSAVLLAMLTKKYWLSLGWLVILLPLPIQRDPELILADRRYTSVLIHNGTTAIVINPGRRYRHNNDAKLWQRYLQDKRLKLGAIVLENEGLSRISATNWLLSQHPDARVITLTPMYLPYAAVYCQPIEFGDLSLRVTQADHHCNASLHWLGHTMPLFADGKAKNALGKKATLNWYGKHYKAQQLGAITISRHGVDTRRHQSRLWRKAKKLDISIEPL